MRNKILARAGLILLFAALLMFFTGATALAQSTATLQGTVIDPQGGAVPDAKVTVRNVATGVERNTQTDSAGYFQLPSLPVGAYRIEIRHEGFQTLVVKQIDLDVATIVSQNFELKVGELNQTTEVTSEASVVETATMSVGQVINSKTVQEIPLNGRHFVDLGLLIPGSVTPPQNGFLTAPLRGQGSFAFNTAGNREDTVNFMINGINLNDMVQNQITFQPSINTVQEFKVDNSTYSAEYGRNSGAIVNIATRSGSNSWHGEAFEFLRNEALDAKNFFDDSTKPTPPFKRNQFGAALGGPIWKDRTFFFFSYEGLRQRQGLTVNTIVPTSKDRTNAVDPTVVKLLQLVPAANAVPDSTGLLTRFIGSGTAPVNIDQWTIDVSHNIGQNDRMHGYYAFQRDLRQEPTLQGDNIPGFGDTRQSRRQILTVNETHLFTATLANEARLGFNRIHITFTPNAQLNPADFGINNGITTAIGLPQIVIGRAPLLNFAGPAGFPQGRGDTTAVFSDTLTWVHGRHSWKFGSEVRRFYNNNFNFDTGQFNFPTIGDFINAQANQFQITLGSRPSRILINAFGFFGQDSFKVTPRVTLELGLRYDWNGAPTEALNRFVVYTASTNSLVQVGSGIGQPYKTSDKNVEPRVGFAWDPFGNGKTSVRGGFAIQTDQPVANLVGGLSSNPPLAQPLLFTSGAKLFTTFATAQTDAAAAGLAPSSVDPNFNSPYVQEWNLNVEREITPSIGIMVGYFGSKGTHLRISRNINQKLPNGTRPVSNLSASSPIKPSAALGNIFEVDSASNSSYHALWATANKRLSHGLQFNASYTYSKSIDYNSLSSQGGVGGVVVQDSNNIRGDRGVSDFDVRHRFVINALYELPFKGNRWVEGWQLSTITQLQGGNPVNLIVASNAFTGLATVRPDLLGAIQNIGDPAFWFNNSVCNEAQSDPKKTDFCAPGQFVFGVPQSSGPNAHLGNLGRNVVLGPGFINTDFSALKTTRITESMRIQFRAEIFDLFNHPNLGQPGRLAQIPLQGFSQITSTRFPKGDSGSSRQVQFALKLIF